MFMVKPIFSRYVGWFLVTTPSVEMTKRYIDTFLIFPAFLFPEQSFNFSEFFLSQFWEGH
jgi:hypothetical protein